MATRKKAAPRKGRNAAKKTGGKRVTKARPNSARQAFVEGLIARGEAVEVKPGQSLPRGATHAIVGRDKAGRPVVTRRRFSLT